MLAGGWYPPLRVLSAACRGGGSVPVCGETPAPAEDERAARLHFRSERQRLIGAGTIPVLHQNDVLINEKQGVQHPQNCRPKGVKGPWVPCGVSFPSFFPLVERKMACGARTRLRHSGESVSASGVNS